jgi:hypothetical protein
VTAGLEGCLGVGALFWRASMPELPALTAALELFCGIMVALRSSTVGPGLVMGWLV